MKKIFTLVSSLFIVLLVNAQSPKIGTVVNPATTPSANNTTDLQTSAPSEDLLILKEVEFDFGKIPQGKPVTHIFEVSNKSKDTLKISNVQASCGCTTPEWDKDKAVAPGKTTQIKVGYNAAAEGPFTKQITVTYNAPTTKVITIKGEVWKTPAASAPENKSLNDLKN